MNHFRCNDIIQEININISSSSQMGFYCWQLIAYKLLLLLKTCDFYLNKNFTFFPFFFQIRYELLLFKAIRLAVFIMLNTLF